MPKTQKQVNSSLKKLHDVSRVSFVTVCHKVTEPQTGVMYLTVTKEFAIMAKMPKSVNVAIHIVTVINIIILIILLLLISGLLDVNAAV